MYLTSCDTCSYQHTCVRVQYCCRPLICYNNEDDIEAIVSFSDAAEMLQKQIFNQLSSS